MSRSYAWFVFLCACLLPAPARAALRVVTTTTDLADIVASVGADHVTVESITVGTQDPHYIQAKPSYMVKLSRADLLVSVGLELEVGWLPSLLQGARNPSILPGHSGFLEAASAINPIEVPSGGVDRSQGDVHPLGNPHFWLDPENGKRVAALIAQRLGELDEGNKSAYLNNLARFNNEIDEAIKRWQKLMDPFRGTKVVSYHKTFNYFFQRFGLVPAGYVEERPGIPPGPSHAAELIRQMRSEPIKILFHENYFDRATSDLIAGKASATVLVLPTSVGGTPVATNYISLLDGIVRGFAGAMKEQGK